MKSESKVLSARMWNSRLRSQNVSGKEKRTGAYPKGRTSDWKKAVVKLSQESKNIEIFEGMV